MSVLEGLWGKNTDKEGVAGGHVNAQAFSLTNALGPVNLTVFPSVCLSLPVYHSSLAYSKKGVHQFRFFLSTMRIPNYFVN